MLLANDAVQALLVIRREVAICELVAGQGWMVASTGAFDRRDR